MEEFPMLTIFLMILGCNPCQTLCSDMASYAEKCGVNLTSSDVDSCVEAQSEADADARKACSQARPNLEEEWSCEDVERYFATASE